MATNKAPDTPLARMSSAFQRKRSLFRVVRLTQTVNRAFNSANLTPEQAEAARKLALKTSKERFKHFVCSPVDKLLDDMGVDPQTVEHIYLCL